MILRTMWAVCREMLDLSNENQRLRRQVVELQKTAMLLDRQRGYWVAYQQQTATDAMRAQEILVAKIDELAKKLGQDVSAEGYYEHLAKWKQVRVEGKDAHPFAPNFSDVGSSPVTAPDPSLLEPLPRRPSKSG